MSISSSATELIPSDKKKGNWIQERKQRREAITRFDLKHSHKTVKLNSVLNCYTDKLLKAFTMCMGTKLIKL
jgi:hypothetical protein